MEDKNQLNDIVLNKKGSSGSTKKIMLAAAVLMIILIIVIIVMNSLSSNSKNNLETGTKASQLPKPPAANVKQNEGQDQLFKPVTVIHENNTSGNTNSALDKIAQKLKAQSMAQQQEPAPKATPTKVTPDAAAKPVVQQAQKVVKHLAKAKEKVVAKITKKVTYSGTQKRYIQVGAFSKYKPNKKFLAKIKQHGYSVGYKKVVIKGRTFTKVLIGPFASESLTREALGTVKKDINPQAFITSK